MLVRWIPHLFTLAALCLILVACGSEDTDGSGTDTDDGTPTTEASPTSESSATPFPTESPTASISIGDLTTLDWQLVEIDGAPVPETSVVTLNLAMHADNLITGYGDCHYYMATIMWDASMFRISESGPFPGLDQTERVCQNPQAGPEQDTAFFTALVEAASYHASDEQLVLHDGDGQPRLVFVSRGIVEPDPALTGEGWLLTELDGASLLPGTSTTIAFGHEGVTGNDGCNGYGGGFLVASDGRLTFAGMGKDEEGCLTPEGVLEQAERYYQALAHASSYHVDGDQLQIMDHSGNTTLRFIRQETVTFDPNLAAHRWGLIEANDQPAIPGSLVTLELAEGSISGSDGCNFYGSELVFANNGSIKVATEGFTQTDAGCRSDDLLPQAELVTGILRDGPWYQIDGDRLTIGDAAGNTLVFGPQAEVLLIGSSWSVPNLYTELPGGEIRGDALVEGTEITLTFNADGTLEGNASCNTYGGDYTLDGASITIDSLYWTEMACPDPPGVMEQEMTYLDTLQAVTTWEIGMNGLTLKTDDGRALRELQLVSP